MSPSGPGRNFDTIIIGAGILGLWAARYVIGEGRSCCVIEKNSVGAGASGGILGALMGHIPDGWNQKKQFQFQALAGLEGQMAQLYEDTGISTGYRRCGRLSPLANEGMLDRVEGWLTGAQENWQGQYRMDYLEPGQNRFSGIRWPPANIAPYGSVFDSFSARVSPRKIVAALAEFASRHAQLMTGTTVRQIIPEKTEVVLENGDRYSAGEIIVTAGVDCYSLLFPFMAAQNDHQPLGRGVVGQAVMVEYNHDDTLPILYQDGVYIVPHENNLVAIGSTSHNVQLAGLSEKNYRFDEQDMDFYHKAIALAPDLQDAPIVERWVGVRPRNTLKGRGADPWFEPVPGYRNLIALMGGFKITFGIAPMAMAVARGLVAGPRRQKK